MGAETYPTTRPVAPTSANTTAATAVATGRGDKASTGTGTGVSYGDRDHDRELAVEGPTDMGVLVYQMVQQQTQVT